MEKLKNVIAQTLNVDVNLIEDNKNLKEDLGADSLKFADLFMNIEEEFNLNVDNVTEEELLSVQTVKDIKELINKYSK